MRDIRDRVRRSFEGNPNEDSWPIVRDALLLGGVWVGLEVLIPGATQWEQGWTYVAAMGVIGGVRGTVIAARLQRPT